MKIRVPATRIGTSSMADAPLPRIRAPPGRFFGNSPEFWLNLQQMHDLSKAKLELNKTIEREVEAYVA